MLEFMGLFLENSLFLTRERELTMGFRLVSFQVGLLIVQLLLIGLLTPVGIRQQAHVL
jgi:hypothetical protein